MGKQYNKKEKQNRRKDYLDRKKAEVRENIAKTAKSK
jgi:hypothetical protein